MSSISIEGVVKNGQIILPKNTELPESAKVIVFLPGDDRPKRIMSPRLVNKSDAKLFIKTVEDDIEDPI